ncbi:MAG: alpha/beta hydrolase [Bacteroidota bacterium]
MKYATIAILLLFLLSTNHVTGEDHLPAQDTLPKVGTIIYLFPGQGADYRQYREIEFPAGYDTVRISYPVPEKRENMREFALRFVPLIDQDAPFVLMGVSLGGMICTELADTLKAERVILISSAKSYKELPGRYNFSKRVAVNRIVPKGLTKAGARMLQGIVEPDRRYDKETFKDMLKRKDACYLKRTVDMIVHWERTEHHPAIVHIHGDADHTIPVKHVNYDYLVEEGSHMMVLTRAGEISGIIREILEAR